MIYPLHKYKNTNYLETTSGYYSDKYAQRMCNLYLKDEIHRNEDGKTTRYYRLHAKHPHTQEMALAYDIQCPKCRNKLKQVGRQNTMNELGLYTCNTCNKRF